MPVDANRHTDANVHADHAEAVAPNCDLGPIWRRDLTEGHALAAVLDGAAARRGRAVVRVEVLAWLGAAR